MPVLLNYLLHLLSGAALLGVFVLIYCKVTPFDELALIRKGCVAAALSFGGALFGFSLTIAAAIMYNPNLLAFLAWAGGAMLVQLITYLAFDRMVPGLPEALSGNNVAVGALIGISATSIGVVNAACMS